MQVINAIRSLVVAAAAIAPNAWAESWPAKPIKIVVSNAPGGSTDIIARLLAEKLQAKLGQPIIIDNRPGAGGTIAADVVAKAPPDGYTFYYTVSGFAASPVLIANLPYDTRRDFAPVAMPVRGNVMIVVNPSVPVSTLADFITYSKAHPDALNYGSPSNAVTLAVELFKNVTGAKISQVPYKGSVQAMTDFIGGQIQVLFDPSVTMLSYVNSGKAKALAVTGTQRDPGAPTVPTVQESGYQGYVLYSWQGLFAPAKTAKATLEKMEKAISDVMKMPDVRDRLTQLGVEPIGASSIELAATMDKDMARWAAVAKQIGMTPQ